jgi:serine/threonine protein kinase
MSARAQDDDLVMSLVELALARPADEREQYVRSACPNDSELFDQVWKYVQLEQRMNGFLLDPLYPAAYAHPFEPGEFLDEALLYRRHGKSRFAPDFKGNDRFEVIRCLGSGGMGVVYEVKDRSHGVLVALKTLSKADPESVYRFKNEFRSLAGITHPNLVGLYELIATADEWFFTMELIEGQNFLEYLQEGLYSDAATLTVPEGVLDERDRGDGLSHTEAQATTDQRRVVAPQCDLAKLRAAFSQLVGGVRAIHAAGKLHRDLKPSNVIVTRSGRVVILDFGLAVDLRRAAPGTTVTQFALAGTPRYMSPEQAQGASLSEASDWYSAGMMMFEALTGRCLLPGNYEQEILQRKLTAEAAKPSDICDGIPEDLDVLCRDLLQLKPQQRPGGEEIIRRLGVSESQPTPLWKPPSPAAIVGREAPLAVMREAFAHTVENGPALVYIRGESGMGKSALLELFLSECARRKDTVVLSGRCNEQESIPFKALDALMDSLGSHLRSLATNETAELLPRHVNALAQMFPQLLRAPAIARAPRERGGRKDDIEYRQMASTALRDLLSRITDRRRLVIAVDDLQWGDLDSAILITELLEPPDPPPLLLLVALRSEEEHSSPCLAYLGRDNLSCRRFSINLEPLTTVDVREMSARLGGETNRISADLAQKIARESGGNPLFIHEVLGNESATVSDTGSVDDLIWNRVVHRDYSSRILLEVVSVSGRPLDLRLAFQAAHLQEDSLPVYTELRNARLLRRAGAIEPERAETYHDRIRETIASRLDPETLRAHHYQLALALQSTSAADPEHIAFHLESSGENEQAGEYFARAAHRAAAALAFDQAATLCERALRLSGAKGDARRNLLTRLAEALANSGRSQQAAKRFEEAAREASGTALLELKQRAAYYYCISGHIDEGKDAFRDVLKEFGINMPSTAGEALAALLGARTRLWFRGLKFHERPAESVPTAVRERLGTVWSAAVGLGNADVISGRSFSTRSVILSLDAGDPALIVRSLLWEACVSAIDNVSHAQKLIDRAEEVMKRYDSQYLRGLLLLAKAIYTINLTRWRDAIPLFDLAEETWREHCTGVDWELCTARHFCFWALVHSGEFLEAGRRISICRRQAEERGNLYMVVNIGCYSEPAVLLAGDRPEEANRVRQDVMARWTQKYYLVQHTVAALAEIESLLYVGRGVQAWLACQKHAEISHKHNFDRLAMNRVVTAGLSLNSALLAASQTPDPSPHLKDAAKLTRHLEKEHLPWAAAMAVGGRAAIALAHGNRTLATDLLERCIAKYDEIGLHGFSFIARRHLGQIVAGDRGGQLIAEAEAWMRAHGVVNSDRFSNRSLSMFGPCMLR